MSASTETGSYVLLWAGAGFPVIYSALTFEMSFLLPLPTGPPVLSHLAGGPFSTEPPSPKSLQHIDNHPPHSCRLLAEKALQHLPLAPSLGLFCFAYPPQSGSIDLSVIENTARIVLDRLYMWPSPFLKRGPLLLACHGLCGPLKKREHKQLP